MENSVISEPEPPDQAPLQKLVQMVDSFYSATRTSEAAASRNRDYYDGKQLTKQEREALQKRGQPPVVENVIKRAVNSVVGVARDQAVDPRAFPRNGSDQDIAASEVATKSLRFVSDGCRFDTMMRPRAFQAMLVEGVVACDVEVDHAAEVSPVLIQPHQVIYDPFALDLGFSDAQFLGHYRWAWLSDVAALYPHCEGKITASAGGADERREDRPRFGWVDKGALGQRVAVVTLYVRIKGQWHRAVFCESYLLEFAVSPYLDEDGNPTCTVIVQAVYRDRDNSVYAYVADLIDLQDEINKRRSKLLHVLNVRQLQEISDGSFNGNVEDARREAARPDGVIPAGLQVSPTSDFASGQAQLLMQAKADFDRASPNPAILGRQGADASGRAMQVRQQAGLTELWAEFSALEDFTVRAYRAFWARIKQFWDGPRFIRVTDDLKAPQMLQINEPVMEMRLVAGPYGGLVPQEVEVGQKNRVAEMDMDIIIDVSPNTANLASEQYALLVDLAKAGVPIPPDAIIRASSLPEKAAILEQMKPKDGPAPQDRAVAQKAEADIRKTNADAAKSEASAAEIGLRAGLLPPQGGFAAPGPELPPPGEPTGDPAMMAG
ncbi:MAG: hypothetical protein ACRC56_11920 [Bosea sp. (in: a-proteobacteria)]